MIPKIPTSPTQVAQGYNSDDYLQMRSTIGSFLPSHVLWGSTVVAAIIAAWFGITRKRTNNMELLQPILMASVAARHEMRTPSEALALWSKAGFTILDIRSEMEGSDGRIRGPNKGTADIPLINARLTYDTALGQRVLKQEANSQWLAQVKAAVPPSAKVVVMCSDGGSRTQQALSALTAEGYRQVFGMSGGYAEWSHNFDRQQRPRDTSGRAAPGPDAVQWISWAEAAGPAAAPQRLQSTAAVASAAVPSPAGVFSGTPEQALFEDPAFIAATFAAFPAKPYATIEEARVLWKKGNYVLLDIRSELEGTEGRIRGPTKQSVDIPLFHATTSYDYGTEKRVVGVCANPRWLDIMKDNYPTDATILLMCGDGVGRSVQAQKLLAAEGFRNVVIMSGGYAAWDAFFDKKLAVRTSASRKQKVADLAAAIQWGTWTAEEPSGRVRPPPNPAARPRAITSAAAVLSKDS